MKNSYTTFKANLDMLKLKTNDKLKLFNLFFNTAIFSFKEY